MRRVCRIFLRTEYYSIELELNEEVAKSVPDLAKLVTDVRVACISMEAATERVDRLGFMKVQSATAPDMQRKGWYITHISKEE